MFLSISLIIMFFFYVSLSPLLYNSVKKRFGKTFLGWTVLGSGGGEKEQFLFITKIRIFISEVW